MRAVPPESAPLGDAEDSALRLAIELAQRSGLTRGPNPAVGCVVLDPHGDVIATGWHEGAGTPHAEVVALTAAGTRARGATAVVSLEPCTHHGRTPPCVLALLDAGIARVVYAQSDPNPRAAGGGADLAAAGIDVVGGVHEAMAERVNEQWTRAMRLGRPVVTWKVAASLDGRIAAADGTSQWITGDAARTHVHQLRAAHDAVLTSTATALADRAQLTVRHVPVDHQPERVVMGLSALPGDHPLHDAVLLRTHDPQAALAQLWEAGVRRVLLECGAQLSAAFLAADLIDDVVWFSAPVLLGNSGLPVTGGGPATLTDAQRWEILNVASVGGDVRIDMRRQQRWPDPNNQ